MEDTVAPRKSKRTKPRKVVLEFNVLDEDTKNRIMACIQRRGKITITTVHKGVTKVGNGTDGGFSQKID